MMILLFALIILVGLSMGLVGGGGSVMAVPILKYIKGASTIEATSYSLFIVGISALFASLINYKKRLIDYKTVLIFGLPCIIAVYLTRNILLPNIPEQINISGFESGIEFSKDFGIMILFALFMFASSFSMIIDKKGYKPDKSNSNNKIKAYLLMLIEGLFVGLITGLVGAGGGFLIIPVLVMLLGLDMKRAVGTSLIIVAIKSLLGFIGDLQAGFEVDWTFLLSLSSFSLVGIILGTYLGKYINGKSLKKMFGYFVLIMSIIVLAKELL